MKVLLGSESIELTEIQVGYFGLFKGFSDEEFKLPKYWDEFKMLMGGNLPVINYADFEMCNNWFSVLSYFDYHCMDLFYRKVAACFQEHYITAIDDFIIRRMNKFNYKRSRMVSKMLKHRRARMLLRWIKNRSAIKSNQFKYDPFNPDLSLLDQEFNESDQKLISNCLQEHTREMKHMGVIFEFPDKMMIPLLKYVPPDLREIYVNDEKTLLENQDLFVDCDEYPEIEIATETFDALKYPHLKGYYVQLCNFTPEYLRIHGDELITKYPLILYNPTISQEFIERNIHLVRKRQLAYSINLSDEFRQKHKDLIKPDSGNVSHDEPQFDLSKYVIKKDYKKIIDTINWQTIRICVDVPEDFIVNHHKYIFESELRIAFLSGNPTLTHDLMWKYRNVWCHCTLYNNKNVSEDMMEFIIARNDTNSQGKKLFPRGCESLRIIEKYSDLISVDDMLEKLSGYDYAIKLRDSIKHTEFDYLWKHLLVIPIDL